MERILLIALLFTVMGVWDLYRCLHLIRHGARLEATVGKQARHGRLQLTAVYNSVLVHMQVRGILSRLGGDRSDGARRMVRYSPRFASTCLLEGTEKPALATGIPELLFAAALGVFAALLASL